ncbi:unnamed protein product [Dibothriocephalus latus]|uniref:Uncharacterized protein n=1 Tax=Dibothriocephalus latus TaxID=60516 RepID=A0A3P7P244_DIBLA|nr:unnamed protein product [Dibothriocephalus latus]
MVTIIVYERHKAAKEKKAAEDFPLLAGGAGSGQVNAGGDAKASPSHSRARQQLVFAVSDANCACCTNDATRVLGLLTTNLRGVTANLCSLFLPSVSQLFAGRCVTLLTLKNSRKTRTSITYSAVIKS